MKLHLLRHAKTQVLSFSGKDIDRELAEKGLRQAIEMKTFLSKTEWKNTLLLCSDATRTKQTLENVTVARQFKAVEYTNELYLAEPYELKTVIAGQENHDLFIIGHNDGLSALAEEVCGNSICLKTCEYIELECPGNDWADIFIQKGRIIAQFHPKVD
ncbi:MAG: histidine phosphatase family protein [Flavobacteriia bacterium]|nr:histidine phosphatase family protein [Flavobacteriia bacterium]